jgi:hypothetical protein
MTNSLKHCTRFTAAVLTTALFLHLTCWLRAAEPVTRKTQNVLLITLDGLRWQDLFGGADLRLGNREAGGVRDVPDFQQRFVRDSETARREVLMPFFWQVIARDGQVFGDPQHNCAARVTNGHFFSYPGYHEILTGYADARIDSNDKIPNPNATVLEWLHRRPRFQGRVAAFCCWDVFPFIINSSRSGIPVNAGWQPLKGDSSAAAEFEVLNLLASELPRVWSSARYDVFTFRGALYYLKNDRPRVFYIALDETDDWAHEGRYDLYLEAAQRSDRYIRRLWETLQSIEQYAGKTSLVLTTDHGRGDTRDGWKSHGKDIPGSDRIWMAVMGPDTPPTGIRSDVEVTQGQTAATVAALLGEDYNADQPKAAPPLPGIMTANATTTPGAAVGRDDM